MAHSRRLAIAITLLASARLGAQGAQGAQPAMFRGGPAHAGATSVTGVPAFGGLQWRVQTEGPVRASPTLAGGRVYVGSADGAMYAIDAASGRVVWRRALGAPVMSTAAVAGGAVYVTAGDGSVHALRASDGSSVWRFRGGRPAPLLWGRESGEIYESSPAVVGDAVVVGSVDGNVYALDARTGRTRWRYAAGARVYSSPAVAGRVVYVGAQDGTVHAIQLATGRRAWRFDTEGHALHSADFGFDRTTVQSSPAVVEGVVYVGARDGFLYAIDAATGTQRWRYDHKVSWVNSSPAVREGLVYAASSDGHFIQAVDATSGAERWRANASNIVWASPTVDDALVYTGEGDGTLYALDRRTGKEAWRYRVGGRILSSVVVEPGRLYFGSDDGGVYAVNAARGPAMRRAVFYDSTMLRVPLAQSDGAVRRYLEARGYEVVDGAGLARFMSDRLRDGAPGTLVFAVAYLPPSVAPVAADTVLARRYLNAGNTIVWLGAPPLVATPALRSLKDLDREAPHRLLGVSFLRGNFDPIATHPTDAGRRLGLPSWWLDTWGADAESVTTVLATDEQGQAAAWVKRFGGPPGTGFIRLFTGDGASGRPQLMHLVQTAAETRGR